MNQFVKKFLSILVSVVIMSFSLNCKVFAEKMYFYHKPVISPENSDGNLIACYYNDKVSTAIIDYFYNQKVAYNSQFHPESSNIKRKNMLGLIYIFNELNGLPEVIHLEGNDHILIIRPQRFIRYGKNFFIKLQEVQVNEHERRLRPYFYYYNGENANIPELVEIWEEA